jgi:hypothetical protein
MRSLAERKRAILLGTMPLQPLFWYGVWHALPGADVGAGIVCIAGAGMSIWLTIGVGFNWFADGNRSRY